MDLPEWLLTVFMPWDKDCGFQNAPPFFSCAEKLFLKTKLRCEIY